jgi:DNA topoisomerase I
VDLIIVESPAKARTIKGYLGKGYKVLSSYGHVRDLPKSKLGVAIDKNYQPTYRVLSRARRPLNKIRKELARADNLYLATDLDREGEAIAWHLVKALKLKPSSKKIKRITFGQVTKPALKKAISKPRSINQKLVDGQQARRILDRLVGYQLSPLLWKKIARGLSAGRVQSVTVRLIVERERKIEEFKPKKYWQIIGRLKKDQIEFPAQLSQISAKKVGRLTIDKEEKAKKIEKDLKDKKWRVDTLSRESREKQPFPPYTTATLQRDAAFRLGFSARKTMFLAQKLYEGVSIGKSQSKGLITYTRTDSVKVAKGAITATRKYLKEKYPKMLPSKILFYRTKSKSAQEAHEAIRPTDPNLTPEKIEGQIEPDQSKLYRLIWQRMIASQMTPICYQQVKAKIRVGQYIFLAQGQQIKDRGFSQLYPVKLKEFQLPQLTEGEELNLKKLEINGRETQPPTRYTESSLVKELERLEIGRPSTYAPTISTIQQRNYIEKIGGYFQPTEIGMVVNDLLVEHFPKIVSYKFTAEVEKSLDQIARGQKDWVKVIDQFYQPFSKQLKDKKKEISREKIAEEKIGQKCPQCGNDLVKKLGRYGRFIACSNYPDCKYSRPLKNQKKRNQLTAEEKKRGEESLKKNSRCRRCGSKMELKKGRYGIFLGCSNFQMSLYGSYS